MILFSLLLSVVPGVALEVVVTNVTVARQAASRSPVYLQNGAATKADHLNYQQPYCHTFAYRVPITNANPYAITHVQNNQVEDSETRSISLNLATNNSDPLASFDITCFAPSPREATLEDVRDGLNGVYKLQ